MQDNLRKLVELDKMYKEKTGSVFGESTGVVSEPSKVSSKRSSKFGYQKSKSSLSDSTYRPTPNATKELSEYCGLPLPRLEIRYRLKDPCDLLKMSVVHFYNNISIQTCTKTFKMFFSC